MSPVTLELLQITSAIGNGLLDYLTEDLTLEEAAVLLGRLYGVILFEVATSAATAGAANALKGAEGAALTARILQKLESVPGLSQGKLGRISELMTDVVQELQRGLSSTTPGSLNPIGDAFSKGFGTSKSRKLLGNPPHGMFDPHVHHILFKKGLGPSQQALVEESQAILRKAGIDPIDGKENLAWAPWRVSKQHGIESLRKVVDKLRELDKAGADYDDFVNALRELGEEAARRNQ